MHRFAFAAITLLLLAAPAHAASLRITLPEYTWSDGTPLATQDWKHTNVTWGDCTPDGFGLANWKGGTTIPNTRRGGVIEYVANNAVVCLQATVVARVDGVSQVIGYSNVIQVSTQTGARKPDIPIEVRII